MFTSMAPEEIMSPNGTRISRRRLPQRAPHGRAPQAVGWMRLLYGWREWAKPPRLPTPRAAHTRRARDFSFTFRRAV
jgi:hypothetical protein